MAKITRGEPALVEQLRSSVDSEIERLCGIGAAVWSRYALASVKPSAELTVNRGVDGLLRPLLGMKDRWLLSIPRVLVPGSVSIQLAVSEDGGAAMGLPWAAYGGLLRLNQLIVCLDLDRARLRDELPAAARWKRRSIQHKLDSARDYGLVVSHWFTAGSVARKAERESSSLVVLMDGWTRGDGRSYHDFIVRTTMFQQAMMVLHGFGRVIVQNRYGHDRATLSLSEELAADTAVSPWAGPLAGNLFPDRRIDAAQALLILFTAMDIANDFNGQPVDPHNLALRCMMGIHELGGDALIPDFDADLEQVMRDPTAVPDLFRNLRLLLGSPRHG